MTGEGHEPRGWRNLGRGRRAGARYQLWPCCDRVGADITVLREREVDYDSDMPRKITEVLVRKVPDNQQVSLFAYAPPPLPLLPFLYVCFGTHPAVLGNYS